MSLARTRIAARLLAVAALAALTAGCFQPMYAERADGTPGLREKLMGVEVPPVDKPNASREARIQVEIRNALAFKLYGTATGMPPTHRLVLRFSTSALLADARSRHRAALERELRHRRAVQSDRARHQQVGHDRHDLLARRPTTFPASCSASPAPAPSATPRIAPRRRSPRTSRPRLRASYLRRRHLRPRRSGTPDGRASRKRHRRLSRPARFRPPHHPALRPRRRPGARARRRADGLRRRRSQRSLLAGAARRRRTVRRAVAAGR